MEKHTLSSGDRQTVSRGFVPFVVGDRVEVDRGGGLAFIAKRQLALSRGGGQWMISGGDLMVRQGGSAVMIAPRARVDHGFVGALFAGRAELQPGVRVLLRPGASAALCAGAGFLAGLLVGRRRRRRSDR